MELTAKAIFGVLIALATTLPSLPGVQAAQSPESDRPLFERDFMERFNSITIENPDGRTEVQTWGGGRLRVVVSGHPGGGSDPSTLTPLHFDDTEPAALKISVSPAPKGRDFSLKVYVPTDVNLKVRGGKGSVTIRGATSSVSVDTDSGSISLYLPATAGTDLSLHTISGAITSQLPVLIFGPLSSRSLDGRLNQGGAPVILRSESGAIDLLTFPPGSPSVGGQKASGSRQTRDEWGQVKASQRVLPRAPEVGAAADTGVGLTDADKAGGGGPTVTRLVSHANPDSIAADPEGITDEVIKIDTHLIDLNVRVADASGRLVPDLTQDDFQLFENNVRQEIAHFEPVTAPVNLVLLLDLSGSTKDRMKIMKGAAKKFIDSLRPDARIAVAAFARNFMVVSNFTGDRKLLKSRIDGVKNFNSGTAFYDSMWAALDLFHEIDGKRKAVVVLTDGVDSSLSYEDHEPRHPFDELLARVVQEDVTIYPIYFDTEYEAVVKRRGRDSHEAYVTARLQLGKIADGAGGTLFMAERAEDLEGVYQRVASELQTLYSIAYYPQDKNFDGGWRAVGVRVIRPQVLVKTRPGYYAK